MRMGTALYRAVTLPLSAQAEPVLDSLLSSHTQQSVNDSTADPNASIGNPVWL
jgi:hypothetical protein